MATRSARGHAVSGGGRGASTLGSRAAVVVAAIVLTALPRALRVGVDNRSDSQVMPADTAVELELRVPDLPPPAPLPAGDPVTRLPRLRVATHAAPSSRPAAHFVVAGRTSFWATTLPPPSLS